jgi:hypothetical protein
MLGPCQSHVDPRTKCREMGGVLFLSCVGMRSGRGEEGPTCWQLLVLCCSLIRFVRTVRLRDLPRVNEIWVVSYEAFWLQFSGFLKTVALALISGRLPPDGLHK